MAGVLTQSNSFRLTGKIGRRPTDGELYMAHFMGVGGAAKLISNAEDNPQASGARLFPNAAAANRSIFYERTGRARSVSEVYSVLTQRYASAANSPATRTAMASVGVTPTAVVAAARPVDNAAYLSSFPDARQGTPVAAASQPAVTTASLQPGQPMFRSLFHAGERAQPVSPAVQELWGNGSSLTSVATAVIALIADAKRPRAATARSLQRPQRHLQRGQPRSSPRRRGPIRRVVSFWHWDRCLMQDATPGVMGPRLRGDDVGDGSSDTSAPLTKRQ